MRTIIVYSAKHHMNTEKVAQAIAGELKAEARKVTDVKPADLDGFALLGFGSGINGFDVHPEMHALVDDLGEAKGRRAFLFSTCASRKKRGTLPIFTASVKSEGSDSGAGRLPAVCGSSGGRASSAVGRGR